MKRVILIVTLLLFSLSAQILKTAAQMSEPKFVGYIDGSIGGIAVDVMRAIEEIDSTIMFVGDQTFIPFRRIEVYLERGELDLFFGFARNPEREAKYIYVDPPIYVTGNAIAVRRNDPIDDIADWEGLVQMGVVLTSAGVFQSSLLREMGVTVDDGAPSLSNNLKKLVSDRGRFLVQSDIELKSAIFTAQMVEEVRVLPTRHSYSGRYVAFASHVPLKTVAKVVEALQILEEAGRLKEIYEKYDIELD